MEGPKAPSEAAAAGALSTATTNLIFRLGALFQSNLGR